MMEIKSSSVTGQDLQAHQHFLRDCTFQVEGVVPVAVGVIQAIEMGARAFSFPGDVNYEFGAIYLLCEVDTKGSLTGKEMTVVMKGLAQMGPCDILDDTVHLLAPFDVSKFDLAESTHR